MNATETKAVEMEKVCCGFCGTEVRRPWDRLNMHLPLIFTRTLIGNRFLPSCSAVCASELRRRIRRTLPRTSEEIA